MNAERELPTPELETDDTSLRYLSATRVDSPAGVLSEFELRTPEDSKLGDLDGVLIDPAAKCVRYYAVGAQRWFGRRRYLVPADRLPQLEGERRTLRIQVRPDELEQYPRLDARRMREFSDEDLLTAMFQSEVA